eukprot:CAMPEP_0202906508 /NCGR_PEP_ID=MMETSP1392-20130828/39186_1 /ASSEMBLY_ACC=CAM_ASM_000868 /TAXON_ID=225041 /ORGANISM="Chlamydomonas chlamydogama, Strain SAG 11-48b" /LENGTH=271 /DNA_ID=CAMNT_0049595051 /DNA_START=132 /DNA_END=951 /DNA_ORIENTATION=-
MPGDTAGAPGARLRSWESLCSSWHLIPAPLYPSLLSSCRHHFHSFCSTIYAATGPAHAAPGSIPAAESAAPAAQGAAPAGTCRSRPYRCLLASKRCDGEVDTADQVAGALLVAAECEGEDGVRVGGCEVASLAEGDGGGVDDGSGGVEVLHGVDEHQTIGQVGGEHRVALDGLEGGLTPVVDAVAHRPMQIRESPHWLSMSLGLAGAMSRTILMQLPSIAIVPPLLTHVSDVLPLLVLLPACQRFGRPAQGHVLLHLTVIANIELPPRPAM